MENKQTPVEWLQQSLSNHLTHEQQMQFEGLFQQAMGMEKEREERHQKEIDQVHQYYQRRRK